MGATPPSLIEQARQALTPRYSEPHRRYHGLAHVQTLLGWLDEYRALAAEPGTVALSIWFHDAIYDPHRADNEARSAELAEALLPQWQAAPALVATVARQVRATAGHVWADGLADTALFLDLDLATLGVPRAQYAAYSDDIRAEYAWVPEADYRQGRAEVLRRFLARPVLYYTPALQARYEAQARANLADEIAQLTGAA